MTRDAVRYTFSRRMRLTKQKEFQAAFDARMRKSVGPLLVYAIPNSLEHPRLGLTVSRRVGNSVRRNRIKRLLREAFRLIQHEFTRPYDIVLVVRRHDPLPLEEYIRLIRTAAESLDARWMRNATNLKQAETSSPPPGSPHAG